jgi:hypothetical protein
MDNEIDILDAKIGETTLREMSAFSFYQWLAKKLNNVKTYSADVVELTTLISMPPMSRTMPNDEKIRIIKKLQKIGVTIL